MQMSAAQMQHQQLIRSQSGMAGSGMANSSQMQQLLSQQHQQQTLAMQQSNNQMSMQMQMSQTSSVNSVSTTGAGKFHTIQETQYFPRFFISHNTESINACALQGLRCIHISSMAVAVQDFEICHSNNSNNIVKHHHRVPIHPLPRRRTLVSNSWRIFPPVTRRISVPKSF